MKYLIKSTLLLLTILFSATAWGQTTITFIPGETFGNNEAAGGGADSMEKDGITISTTNGGLKAQQYRFAKGSVTTITSTIGNITNIEFTCSASDTETYGPGCFAAQSGYSYEGNVGTWVGSAASVEFTAETHQVRATQIVVTVSVTSIDNTFLFIDNEGHIFENGATVVRTQVVPLEEGGEKIDAGVSVLNCSGEPNDYIVMHYTINRIDNGAYQICFASTCNTQYEVGSYATSSGQLVDEMQDIMSEWLPLADGECDVTLAIEVLTKKAGFPPSYEHKAYGPSLNIKFIKGELHERIIYQISNLFYLITGDNTVAVTYKDEFYNSYSGNVIIPESVSIEGKYYQVVGIDSDAFYYCTNLKGLSIPVTIENINHNAFYGCYNLEWIHIYGAGAWSAGEINASYSTLYIGKEVASLSGLRAYPSAIYSYATTPPVCDENTFMDYSATLHVPATSLAAYFTAPHWCNFANIVGDAVEPDMVTIGNDSIETTVNSQFTLTASATPVNSTPNAITWKSSNTNVAIVNEGIVTAVGIGECDIFAQCLDKQAICHVTIKEPIITIYLDQEEASVLPNHIIVLEPSSSSDILPELSVTSSDPTIAAARVMNGKIQVVGIKEGTATITVGSADGTAVPATCLVTVYTEPGDVNMDGFLDVSDVTALISHVLGGHVENFKAENGDLNGDGVYDVSDVTALIALVLNNNG